MLVKQVPQQRNYTLIVSLMHQLTASAHWKSLRAALAQLLLTGFARIPSTVRRTVAEVLLADGIAVITAHLPDSITVGLYTHTSISHAQKHACHSTTDAAYSTYPTTEAISIHKRWYAPTPLLCVTGVCTPRQTIMNSFESVTGSLTKDNAFITAHVPDTIIAGPHTQMTLVLSASQLFDHQLMALEPHSHSLQQSSLHSMAYLHTTSDCQ